MFINQFLQMLRSMTKRKAAEPITTPPPPTPRLRPRTSRSEYEQIYGASEAAARSIVEPLSGPIREILQKYVASVSPSGKCDRAAAEAAVTDAYAAIGLEQPVFIWFDSPLAAVKFASIVWLALDASQLQKTGPAGTMAPGRRGCVAVDIFEAARGMHDNHLQRAIREHALTLVPQGAFPQYNALVVREACRDAENELRHARPLDWCIQIWQNVRHNFANHPREKELIEKYFKFLGGLSDDAQWNELGSALNRVTNQFNTRGPGDAFDVARIECLGLFGQPLGQAFHTLARAVRECGCWWPFETLCIMSDRPVDLHLTAGTLHRFDEPAISYSDGWSLYCLRDLRVSENVAKGEFTTVEIDEERNLERRSRMLMRYGEGRYLNETGAEVINIDEFGVLYRKKWIDSAEAILIVRVTNATPEADGTCKEFYLRVPPTMKTAREAVAWTFGMREQEYAPTTES